MNTLTRIGRRAFLALMLGAGVNVAVAWILAAYIHFTSETSMPPYFDFQR